MTIVGSIGESAILENPSNLTFQRSVAFLRPNSTVTSSFLRTTIESSGFQKELQDRKSQSAQPGVYLGELEKIPVSVPSLKEQEQIGSFFTELDDIITLHQRKLDGMKLLKKSLLQKMFPKNGESVPEVRFPGFTDAWTQSKFGPLVTIERGGSPRPIDRFITDSPNGLNWVKIGDAPKQGNYITKTAEKIRPEGLSKTREVHPGDLILSNSMSFGKPYIMAINGCIHDGWLAIRNYQNSFDLKFLCVLLGTSQMLSQYKAMAAGSTVNNLNKELVGSTMVKFPCLDEQRKIGRFFESFEDSLSINQREIDELQKLKTSFSQQMFV